MALQTAVSSNSTPECPQPHPAWRHPQAGHTRQSLSAVTPSKDHILGAAPPGPGGPEASQPTAKGWITTVGCAQAGLVHWDKAPSGWEKITYVPIHSPLLQQPQLLFVPPLSDMLKLSG